MIFAAIEVSAFGGWPERAFVGARETVRRFESTASPEEEFLRVLLGGLDALAEGDSSTAAERLTEAVSRGERFEQPQLLRVAAAACVYLGDPVRARKLYQAGSCCGTLERVVPRASDQSLLLRPRRRRPTKGDRGRRQCDGGNRDRARAGTGESRDGFPCAARTGSRIPGSRGRVSFLGGRGDTSRARSQSRYRVRKRASRARGARPRVSATSLPRLSSSRCSARTRLRSRVAIRTTPDFVEAAVRSGEPQVAAQALERFAPWAAQAPGPSARGVLARCRATRGD